MQKTGRFSLGGSALDGRVWPDEYKTNFVLVDLVLLETPRIGEELCDRQVVQPFK